MQNGKFTDTKKKRKITQLMEPLKINPMENDISLEPNKLTTIRKKNNMHNIGHNKKTAMDRITGKTSARSYMQD